MLTTGLLKRCVAFVLGLFVMALGIALSIKANLGTTPISSVPYVYSLKPALSMGSITVLMHGVFILLQIALLRRDYQYIQLLQLPVALAFGVFTDVTLHLVAAHSYVSSYFLQWLLCILSVVLVAFGVFLEVKAKVVYLAGEGACVAIAKVFHWEFGKVKVGFDCTLVAVALLSSAVMFHGVQGVREGTIVSAVLVGTLARFYGRKLKFVDVLLGGKKSFDVAVSARDESRNNKIIVTIVREFGSGGHEIGEIVAKKLGLPFYDTNMIDMSAAESGLSPEYVKEHEQKLAHRLLFELYEQNYAYVNEEKPPLDLLFMVQSKVVREIGDKGGCVIVGRCADFVLKSYPCCFSVFIHANKAYRTRRIVDEYGVARDQAAKVLEMTDKDRANYYRHYTHRQWGMAANYNLTIDSALFGVETTADMIIEAVRQSAQG